MDNDKAPTRDGEPSAAAPDPSGPSPPDASSGSDGPSQPEAPNRYDFRQPPQLRTAVAQRIQQWQRRIRSLLPVKLATHVADLQCDIGEQQIGLPDMVSPPHPMIAFRVQINEEHETILAIQRPLAVTMVVAMLGESPEQLSADRPLTLVEQSLFDLVVRDLVELLDESGESLRIRSQFLGSERRTHLIRLFPPAHPLVLLNFDVQGVFGGGAVSWIWPQSLIESLLDLDEDTAPAPQLPQLAQRIPLELAVRLGRARLTVQQLAQLKPGDVVVLDQSVHEPLIAEVGGTEKLQVWPGRDGSRQAVQIEALVD